MHCNKALSSEDDLKCLPGIGAYFLQRLRPAINKSTNNSEDDVMEVTQSQYENEVMQNQTVELPPSSKRIEEEAIKRPKSKASTVSLKCNEVTILCLIVLCFTGFTSSKSKAFDIFRRLLQTKQLLLKDKEAVKLLGKLEKDIKGKKIDIANNSDIFKLQKQFYEHIQAEDKYKFLKFPTGASDANAREQEEIKLASEGKLYCLRLLNSTLYSTIFYVLKEIKTKEKRQFKSISPVAKRLKFCSNITPKLSLRYKKNTSNELINNSIEYKDRYVDNYEIVLLIDHREKYFEGDKSFFYSLLIENNIKVDKRSLNLGDFIFILQDLNTKIEYLTDIIIERKCISDLVSSVYDNRYYDQMNRLLDCPLELPIYLIEGNNGSNGSNSSQIKAVATIKSLISVKNELNIVMTKNANDTVNFLIRIYKMLMKNKQILIDFDKQLKFEVFQNMTKKVAVEKYEEIFAIQLKQFKGCSSSIAQYLTKKYETLNSFIAAINSEDGKKEMQKLILPTGKKIGPALFNRFVSYYSTDDRA